MRSVELKTKVLDDTLAYSGKELRPHFILEKTGLEGSALIAFAGPCQVANEHLVDWKDRLEGEWIGAASMLHLLGEFFGATLAEGVLFQRLAVASLYERLVQNPGLIGGAPVGKVQRKGNDLFVEGGKLSVSIVTASPVSVLLHLGINLNADGAPNGLKTAAIHLNDPSAITVFAQEYLGHLVEEWVGVLASCAKVRPVF